MTVEKPKGFIIPRPKIGGGIRKSIVGFSKNSKCRLVRFVNRIYTRAVPVFITLTYHEKWTEDFKQWKYHLNLFLSRTSYSFRKLYPDSAGIWRLEFQRRGAPHFHIVAFFDEGVDVYALEQEVKQLWFQIVDDDSREFYEYGVHVQSAFNQRGVLFYLLGGHLSKDKQARNDIKTGRSWGYWGREKLGVDDVWFKSEINEKQYFLLRRIIRNWLPKKGKVSKSYLKYLKGGEAMSLNVICPCSLHTRLLNYVKSQLTDSDRPFKDIRVNYENPK